MTHYSTEPALGNTQHPQYLTFVVGDEEYAVGVLRVREIIQYHAVTRVPRTPAWVRGVINLRGSVVPVVDLAVKFGLPAAAPGRCTCIVLVEVQMGDEPALRSRGDRQREEMPGSRSGSPEMMGMIADEVRQVVDLAPGAVHPPPAFGTRVRVDYLEGMGRVGERMVLMLDVDRLLAADQIVASSVAGTDVAEALGGIDTVAEASLLGQG